MDKLMEPPETQIKPKDLYIVHTFIEDVFTETSSGKSYITLDGIGARFLIGPGTNLHPGDPIKLMFHKEEAYGKEKDSHQTTPASPPLNPPKPSP